MQPNNINVNRPMQQQPGQQPNRFEQMHHSPETSPRRGSSLPWLILGVIVVAAIAGAAFLFRDNLGLGKAENVSAYQAVFLTNGQVYFGKLEGKNERYVNLKDIYYLQVNEPLQQGQEQASGTQPQLSLVKLGNELHGPVDEMEINRDHILFIEDIKKDGRVATAIAEHKANPDAGAQAPATQTPAPAAGTVPAGTQTPAGQNNSNR
jgi:hypothetical protein